MKYQSNEQLAAGMVAGDRDAYLEFSRTFGPRMRAYFIRRGLSTADAEALAVSMITDISLKIQKYRSIEGSGFEHWVFTLVKHGLADWHRRQPQFVPIREEQIVVSLKSPEEPLTPEILAAVATGLDSLPEGDQEILRRRNVFSQTFEDIGRDLQVEPATARVRHHRALKKLELALRSDPRIKVRLQKWEAK